MLAFAVWSLGVLLLGRVRSVAARFAAKSRPLHLLLMLPCWLTVTLILSPPF